MGSDLYLTLSYAHTPTEITDFSESLCSVSLSGYTIELWWWLDTFSLTSPNLHHFILFYVLGVADMPSKSAEAE